MGRPTDELSAPTEAADTEATLARPELPLRVLLLVAVGDGSTRTLTLEPNVEITIGRDEAATISINDSRVSRHHARITLRDGAPIVEDLGSRNGTRVNDAKLVKARQELMGGHRVLIGPAEILVAQFRTLPGAPGAVPGDRDPDRTIVVADPEMQRVMGIARRLGQLPTTCLILGETGVGKDVVARTIHASSNRADAPFVRFNCNATPAGLIESELFGHERGAFTGADRRRRGYVETAAGGSLFLDEVGELPAALQAKLLQFLEHKTITRVGSTEQLSVDVRVIAATHRALKDEVLAGHFREDLYYRLSSFTLAVPPLRDRKGEILPLARQFAAEIARRFSRDVPSISSETADLLTAHDWPGNVRELRNAIEHALVLASDVILPGHLPVGLAAAPVRAAGSGAKLDERLAEVERRDIQAALEAENGNRTRAARRLGISRRALLYKLQKYGLG